jgi:hypothetical protein
MARNIAADDNEAWRAVMVFKRHDTQELVYYYEGIYGKPGTARARVSFWRERGKKTFDGEKPYTYVWSDYYDGWIEKADITWNKAKD